MNNFTFSLPNSKLSEQGRPFIAAGKRLLGGADTFNHFFNTENVKGHFTRKKTRERSECEDCLGAEILSPLKSMGVFSKTPTDFSEAQISSFSFWFY